MKKPTKTIRRTHAFGDLYELLEKKFPDLRTGRDAFDVQGLASVLDYSGETLYKALREFQPLQISVALRLLEASADAAENHKITALCWEDLLPFVLPNYPAYMKNIPTAEADDLLA